MALPYDKEAEKLIRALTDPIIVYPGFEDALPEELKTRIEIERLAQCINCKEEATDSEALAYIMTASLAGPLNEDWYRIYAHLFGKYAETKRLPDDLRQDIQKYKELDTYHLDQLRDLKRWIQRQRDVGELSV